MAMTAGSVVIADDGTVTKSGMAGAIYDEFVNNFSTDNGCQIAAGKDGVATKRGYGNMATHMAVALTAYLAGNAVARVYAATGGLQRSTAIGDLTDPNGFVDTDLPIF